MAGSSKKCITPSQELFKKVVAESKRYSYTDIADDDTYMRAIVLADGENKALIMSSELSVFPLPDIFARMVEDRFGIPASNCILTGTWGHNVFTMGARTFEDMDPSMAEFAFFIHKISMEIIEEAFSKLEKARMGAAVGKSAIGEITDYRSSLTIENRETSRNVRKRKQYRSGLGDGKRPDSNLNPVPDEGSLVFRYRLHRLNDLLFLGINADIYSSYYQKAVELLDNDKLFLLDSYYGNVSSMPDAKNEEYQIYGCGAWGSRCFSAKEAEQAFINAMEELKC